MYEQIFYDRKGNSISMEDWSKLLRNKIIKQDRVGNFFISTVWLGIDLGLDPREDCAPIIFETMVFDRSEDENSFIDVHMERYSTEEEAILGHSLITKIYENKENGT